MSVFGEPPTLICDDLMRETTLFLSLGRMTHMRISHDGEPFFWGGGRGGDSTLVATRLDICYTHTGTIGLDGDD